MWIVGLGNEQTESPLVLTGMVDACPSKLLMNAQMRQPERFRERYCSPCSPWQL